MTHYALEGIERALARGDVEHVTSSLVLHGLAAMLDDRLREIATILERQAPQPGWVEPENCRMHTCSYYFHYLAYGPADLTHDGFHAAEQHCSVAQKAAEEHLKVCTHRNQYECPNCNSFERIANSWEVRVRA